MLEDLAALKRRVAVLSEAIHASERHWPTFGSLLQDGPPNIEVGETYDYVCYERGRELDRKSTTELDRILYWIFEHITNETAQAFEVKHRRSNEDSRRQWFSLQEDILGRLSTDWKVRKVEDHRLILERYPFDDSLTTGAVRGRPVTSSILRTPSARVLPRLTVPAMVLGVVALWLSSVALIFLMLEGIYLLAIPRWWEFNSNTKVATDFYLGSMVIGPIMLVMAYALSFPLTMYLCWLIARRMNPAPTAEDPAPSIHPPPSLHTEAPAPARDETR